MEHYSNSSGELYSTPFHRYLFWVSYIVIWAFFPPGRVQLRSLWLCQLPALAHWAHSL